MGVYFHPQNTPREIWSLRDSQAEPLKVSSWLAPRV